MSNDVHYELFVCRSRSGGWQLLEAAANRMAALERATQVMEAGEALAVRVTKEAFDTATGEFQSLTIKELGEIPRLRESVEVKAELPCFRPQDLYSLHARKTITRLLKEQLGCWKLTTIELLHRADAIEKLEATGTVLQHAIQKVAVAHAGSTRQPVQEIVRKLNDLVARAIERIYQDARARRFPKIQKDDIGAVVREILDKPDPDYLLGAAIAEALAGKKTFKDKLAQLLTFVERAPKDKAANALCLEVVDHFVAEMVSGSAALSELIGQHEELGDALLFMADLFLGSIKPGTDGVHPGVVSLAAAFKADRLPNAKSALAQRIMGDLKGVRRLSPSSLEGELDMSRRLATKMVMGQGKFLSIEEITEAFAVRSKRLVTAEIINDYIAGFDRPDQRIERLIALEENVIGAENKRALAGYILPVITAHSTESALIDGSAPVLRRLSRLAELERAAREAGFDERDKRLMAEALDGLALQLVTRANLFETILRRPGASYDKAVALLRLFARGVLTSGEVSAQARVLVRRLMRQSDFAASLGGEGGPARIEALKALLSEAGVDPSESGRSAA